MSQVEMDKMEGGGSHVIASNSDPNNVEDIQIDTEQDLHTGRGGGDQEAVAQTITGKPQKSFCAKYKIPIIIILIVILIAVIGAAISGIAITSSDDELEPGSNVEVLVNGDKEGYTNGYTNGGSGPPVPPKPIDPASCPKDKFSGYFKLEKKCGECMDDTIFDEELGACMPVLPCEENEVQMGTVCVACPKWQQQIDNKCVDRCKSQAGYHWIDGKCTDAPWSGKLLNGCRITDDRLFKLNDKGVTEFSDDCHMGCNRMYMFLETDASKEDAFFPKAVECCSNDKCHPVHGVPKEGLTKVMIGGKDACIYKIEMQGKASEKISALRFYWHNHEEENGMSVQTVGKYDPTIASESYEIQGCVRGVSGFKDADNSITSLKFWQRSDVPYRCAVESFWPECRCHGDIYLGLNQWDGFDVQIEFDEFLTQKHLVKTGNTWDKPVTCTASNFVGPDPWPGKTKQCYCVHK